MAAESRVATKAADIQRTTVLVLLLVLPLAFWPSALSPFSTVKTAVLFLAVAVLVAAQVVRIAVRGTLSLPPVPVLVGVGVFGAGLTVAALVGDVTGIALFGAYKRHAGLVDYLSYLTVFLVVVRRFDRDTLPPLLVAVLAGCGIVAVFAVLQGLGVGASVLQRAEDAFGVPSTLGNTNFVAAYVAVGTPLLVWGLLAVKQTAARVALAVLGLVLVGALVAAASAQGPLAAAAGLSVFAVAWARSRGGQLRRWAAPVWAVLAVVGGTLVGLGLAAKGPLAALGAQRSFELRRWYWDAAIEMVRDNPLLGVGLDHYGLHYLQERPLAAALSLDLTQTNDAAHSVPLHFLAGGGIVLGLAYLVFVGVIVWTAVGLLGRLGGTQLVAFGALAGALMAYYVQSLVSIDVPPLALLHFVLAGGVVAAANRQPRTVSLWTLPRKTKDRRRLERVAVLGAAVLVLLGGYLALRPLRADLAAGRGTRLAEAGDAEAALAPLITATRLAPWESQYWLERAFVESQVDPAAALESFRTAMELNPGSLAPLISGARVAESFGQAGEARELYAAALEVEPQHPALRVEVARFELSVGNREGAQELVEEALTVDPDNAEAAEIQATLQSSG